MCALKHHDSHVIFVSSRFLRFPLVALSIRINCRSCAYRGLRNLRFLGNLACFVFLKHPF